ncbi:MAG: hypothetical protein HY812_11875 [Planctomycetes bacterium]|nr:hypothetical protein [Planctomycetota bacterium]
MRAGSLLSRLGVAAFLATVMLGATGCQALKPVGTYFVHRYQDFGEMAEFGFTVTATPQVGLYWNSLEALVAGYSEVDGWFVGLGGGQIGVTRHYNKCFGLFASEENVGWGPGLDGENREQVISHRSGGLLGIILPPYDSGPDYTPACVHFFPHIAYFGFVWNARYTQMIDFMLGIFTIDIAGDDGYAVGKWSFPWRSGAGGDDEAGELGAAEYQPWPGSKPAQE